MTFPTRWINHLFILFLVIIAGFFLNGCAPEAPQPSVLDQVLKDNLKLQNENRALRDESAKLKERLNYALYPVWKWAMWPAGDFTPAGHAPECPQTPEKASLLFGQGNWQPYRPIGKNEYILGWVLNDPIQEVNKVSIPYGMLAFSTAKAAREQNYVQSGWMDMRLPAKDVRMVLCSPQPIQAWRDSDFPNPN